MMFQSYSNISKYFLRDYGTIAMVIITTVISSSVNDIFTCEIIVILHVKIYGFSQCQKS